MLLGCVSDCFKFLGCQNQNHVSSCFRFTESRILLMLSDLARHFEISRIWLHLKMAKQSSGVFLFYIHLIIYMEQSEYTSYFLYIYIYVYIILPYMFICLYILYIYIWMICGPIIYNIYSRFSSHFFRLCQDHQLLFSGLIRLEDFEISTSMSCAS